MAFVPLAWIAVAVILCLVAKFSANQHRNAWDVIGVASLGLAILVFFVAIIVTVETYSASKAARFFNAKYGTCYSTDDFYWNGEDIRAYTIGQKLRLSADTAK